MRYVILRRSISGTDHREFNVYTYNHELGIVYKTISGEPFTGDMSMSVEYLTVEVLEDFIECENISSIPEETYEDTSFGWDRQESYDSDGRLISLWVDTNHDGTADWEITYSYYPATSNIYQKTIEDFRDATRQRIQYTYNNQENIMVYEVDIYENPALNIEQLTTTKVYDYNGNLIEEMLFGQAIHGVLVTNYIIGSVL